MTEPETSVVIPVRNGERFVRESIHSALEQLSEHDEILVVDDRSTDTTRNVLAAIDDRRVRVLEGAGLGVSSARNIGVAAATGEFLAFLDHDDLWPPERHAILKNALRGAPEYDCASGRIRLRLEPDAVVIKGLEGLDGAMLTFNLFTSLYRRRIFKRVGCFYGKHALWRGYGPSVSATGAGLQDLYVEADTLIYRRHSTNVTINEAATQDGLMEAIKHRRSRIGRRLQRCP